MFIRTLYLEACKRYNNTCITKDTYRIILTGGNIMLFLDKTPDLSPLDYTIYNYIVDHIDKVVFMRIRELAENTYTSVATIQRFCGFTTSLLVF